MKASWILPLFFLCSVLGYAQSNVMSVVETLGKQGENYDIGGQNVPQDLPKSFPLLLKAAEEGAPAAQYETYRCYYTGVGVQQNTALALSWLVKSANQGFDQAELTLGWHYEKGYGLKQNLDLSSRWYRKAAIQGNVLARECYGYELMFGRGTTQNRELGFAYIYSASTLCDAQLMLAHCYMNGIVVSKDPTDAMKWALLYQRYSPPKQDADELVRSIASGLNEDQLLEATDAADHWSYSDYQTRKLSFCFERSPVVQIPFQIIEGHLVVSLRLGGSGRSVKLVVDTGCSFSMLKPSNLPITHNEYILAPSDGKAEPSLVRLSEPIDLSVDGLRISDVHFLLCDMLDLGIPVDGILGFDILKRLVTQIDFQKNVVTFSKTSYLELDPRSLHIDIRNDNSPFILATISDGRHLLDDWLVLDSGFNGGVILFPGFKVAHPQSSFQLGSLRVVHTLFGDHSTSVSWAGFIQIGNVSIPNPDLLIQHDYAFQWVTTGLLGYELLKKYKVTLDGPEKLLLLDPQK